MQPADKARRQLVEAARRYLELTEGPVFGPVTVLVASGRVAVVSGEPADTGAPDPSRLPRLQRAIYDTLAGGPLSSRSLARRVKRRFNSYFRGVLSRMVKAGLIRRVADGYVRQEHGRTADSQPDKNG